MEDAFPETTLPPPLQEPFNTTPGPPVSNANPAIGAWVQIYNPLPPLWDGQPAGFQPHGHDYESMHYTIVTYDAQTHMAWLSWPDEQQIQLHLPPETRNTTWRIITAPPPPPPPPPD